MLNLQRFLFFLKIFLYLGTLPFNSLIVVEQHWYLFYLQFQDAEGEDGVNAKTESKSETAGPENKNEVEKSVSAGKKDGENAPPPKAPVSSSPSILNLRWIYLL